MRVFVDTSAFFAILDRSDDRHAAASRAFDDLVEADLVTHAYVVVESISLARRRLGSAAAFALLDALLPLVEVIIVDASLHQEAVHGFRTSGGARSVVDETSFAFMRRESIAQAFAFDRDFHSAGFTTLPA